MNKNKTSLLAIKKRCNEAKVGETITCPSCQTKHVKKSYQSVFCKTKGGTKCKDNFWNNVDEKKRNNTTRISPASASFLANRVQGHTSEGYEIINGTAYDEFGDAVYDIDPLAGADYDPGDSEYWDHKDY